MSTKPSIVTTLFLTAVLLCGSFAVAFAQDGSWQLVDERWLYNYQDLDCPDSVTCGAVGDSSGFYWFLRLTSDGWQNSRTIFVDTARWYDEPGGYHMPVAYNRMSFEFRNRLFLICDTTHDVLRSTDMGESWDTIRFPVDDGRVHFIEMSSPDVGFAYVTLGRLFKTVDGGIVWDSIGTPDWQGLGVREFQVVGEDTLVLQTGSGVRNWFLTTTNGGEDWHRTEAPDYTTDFYFLSAELGWVVGARASSSGSGSRRDLIYHTSDGGRSWTTQLDTLLTRGAGLYDVVAVDSLRVRATGAYGRIYRTTNGGQTWIREELPLPDESGSHIREFRYFSSEAVYAIGAFFRLWAYRPKSSGIESRETATVSTLGLSSIAIHPGQEIVAGFKGTLTGQVHARTYNDLGVQLKAATFEVVNGAVKLSIPPVAGHYNVVIADRISGKPLSYLRVMVLSQ